MPEQLLLNIALTASHTFNNFIGDTHRLLLTELQRAMQPEVRQFVYLWGSQGSGRSHLLQACCHFAEEQQWRSCYLPMKQLRSSDPRLCEGLEQLELVAIDDIDAVAGNSAWEEAFFHLHNRLQLSQTELIVSGDQAPGALSLYLPDLRSRLQAHLVFALKTLSDQEKIAVLQAKARQQGFALPDEVGQFLLTRCSREMHVLLQIWEKIEAATLRQQRCVTIPFLKSLLAL